MMPNYRRNVEVNTNGDNNDEGILSAIQFVRNLSEINTHILTLKLKLKHTRTHTQNNRTNFEETAGIPHKASNKFFRQL